MKQEKTSKGITLIALVITIIILLILAGISIATLTGENGLLNKSQVAKEETIKAQLKEELELEISNISAEKMLQGKKIERNDLKELTTIGATIETVGLPAEGEYKDYSFEVDENYKVEIISKLKGEKPQLKVELLTSGVTIEGEELEIKVTATVTDGIIEVIQASEGATIKEEINENEKIFKVTQNGIYYFKAKSNTGRSTIEKLEINTMKKRPEVEIKNIGYKKFTVAITCDYSEELITEYRYYINGELKSSKTTRRGM